MAPGGGVMALGGGAPQAPPSCDPSAVGGGACRAPPLASSTPAQAAGRADADCTSTPLRMLHHL